MINVIEKEEVKNNNVLKGGGCEGDGNLYALKRFALKGMKELALRLVWQYGIDSLLPEGKSGGVMLCRI